MAEHRRQRVSDAVVERAQAGDAAAHEAIAVAFREPVHRYIVTMVGDPELAEDLTQETFRRCVEKLGDLRDPARLGPWLYTIAVNLCRASLRQQVDAAHPANSRPLQQEPQAGRHSVLSRVVQAESAEALAIAIDRLPILLREAFVLHLIAGLPYAEIAWITAASVEALHVRTHRAKALLRHQLGSVVETFWSEM